MIYLSQLINRIQDGKIFYTYNSVPMHGEAQICHHSSSKVTFQYGYVTKITSVNALICSTNFSVDAHLCGTSDTLKLIKVNRVLLTLEEARDNKIISKEKYMYIMLKG